MKLLLFAAAAVALSGADLAGLKTVYLLPMSNGLDQYLAMKLTSDAVLQVVTDPKKADAVFTDRIGHSFEQQFDNLYGHAAKDTKDAKEANTTTGMQGGTRGRGAIFLIDVKTRDVVWSTYERPKSAGSDDLTRSAEKIARRLEKDRAPQDQKTK